MRSKALPYDAPVGFCPSPLGNEAKITYSSSSQKTPEHHLLAIVKRYGNQYGQYLKVGFPADAPRFQ